MTELINKGGFRERANRSRKYKQSENEVTTLQASQYQPNVKGKDSNLESKCDKQRTARDES